MATAIVERDRPGVAIQTTNPVDLLNQMFEAFDAISRRAFEIFESNGRSDGHDVEDWLKAEKELFHPVHLEITESDGSISVKVEVPGFNEKDLRVTMEPSRLTISGKRESSKVEKKERMTHSETCSNEVFRVVDLPAEVDTEKATATLKDGILQLTVPKAANARPLPIKAQAVV
jgi:HSP20 family protein